MPGATDSITAVGIYKLALQKSPDLALSPKQASSLLEGINDYLIMDSLRFVFEGEMNSILTKKQLESVSAKSTEPAGQPMTSEIMKSALDYLKERYGNKPAPKVELSSGVPPPPEKNAVYPGIAATLRNLPKLDLTDEQVTKLYPLIAIAEQILSKDQPFRDFEKILNPGQIKYVKSLTEDAVKDPSIPFPGGDVRRANTLFLLALKAKLRNVAGH
jgi:hypothetical protein